MRAHGWRIGHPCWLAAKFGLFVFLLLPLEAFQAYLARAWLGPGLRETVAPPFSKTLARAISMEEMLRALALPLLALALPLLLWLSFAHPC